MTTVDSATRALELLALGLLPDVNMIITDYWMPEMTGYDLLKKVKVACVHALHYITSDAMCILVTRNRRSSSRSRW